MYLGVMQQVLDRLGTVAFSYYCTFTTIMKYLNCAGNPFLYYFRYCGYDRDSQHSVLSIE